MYSLGQINKLSRDGDIFKVVLCFIDEAENETPLWLTPKMSQKEADDFVDQLQRKCCSVWRWRVIPQQLRAHRQPSVVLKELGTLSV